VREIKRKCWFARDEKILPSTIENQHIFKTKPELMKLLCGEIVQSGEILNVAELVNLKKGERKKLQIIIREIK
jgi:hypothetical protein